MQEIKKKNKNYFFIKFKEAQQFAKISGDFNAIHLDPEEGYNSLYSDNIAHGILILIKLIKLQKLKNYFQSSKFEIFCDFKNPTFYNKKIYIYARKTKNEISFNLIQDDIYILYLKIKINNTNNNIKKLIFPKTKRIKINKNELRKYNLPYIGFDLTFILFNISYFVGCIYPGKNSILKSLIIKKNIKSKNINLNELQINYGKIDKRFPIINNHIKSKLYNIDFISLIRPTLITKKYTLPNKILIQAINKIKENVLIIGGSSGIGKDVLDLFLRHSSKGNKIYATFYFNKIHQRSKRLFVNKINIIQDNNKIVELIRKNNIKFIYYFASPKIYFSEIKNYEVLKNYKKIYVEAPLNILKSLKKFDLNFFYPSTSYIDTNPSSQYSKYKFIAEQKLIQYKNINHNVNFYRLPGIKTKQTLSIVNNTYKDFRYYLQNDKKLYEMFFFNQIK